MLLVSDYFLQWNTFIKSISEAPQMETGETNVSCFMYIAKHWPAKHVKSG